MPYVTLPDGVRLFYHDFGEGRPILLSHGWPLNSESWDGVTQCLAAQGFRVIAHDRRGHGRSDASRTGNEMDRYADDLAAILDALDIEDAILVGHSVGAGEIVRYAARHGTRRVAGLVLVATITPLLGTVHGNADGVPLESAERIRNRLITNRSQFFLNAAGAYFGSEDTNDPAIQGWRYAFWQQGMAADISALQSCIEQYWAADFREEMRHIPVPVLLIHGDRDVFMPLDTTSRRSLDILPDARLLVYVDAPHGLAQTHGERLSQDIAAFARS
jgi:non-heme chloroperoxidase